MTKAEIVEQQKKWYLDMRFGDRGAFHMLLARRMDINKVIDGYSALMAAAHGGNLDNCRDLLDVGAQVNGTGEGRRTPLHLAAYGKNVDIARLLIERGADVRAKDVYGYTPLHCSAAAARLAIFETLIAAGAHVNELNSVKATPLHLAAENGNVAGCKLLIDAGAAIGSQTEFGETPLHKAAMRGRLDACRFLVAHGADVCAVPMLNSKRLTPFQEAIRNGHVELVRFFVVECGQDLAQRTAAGRTLVQIGSRHPEMNAFLRSLKIELVVGEAIPDVNEGAPRPAKRPGGMSPL